MTDDQVANIKCSGWPLPDEYLVELGRIAALWGSLESVLNTCLEKLAGFNDPSDPTPLILLTHAGFQQRLDMVGSLCKHLSSAYPNLTGYEEVIGSLKEAQTLRNGYMHNGMKMNDSAVAVETAIVSARGALKFFFETAALVDLRRVALKIHLAGLRLHNLVLKTEVPPIWERPSGWQPDVSGSSAAAAISYSPNSSRGD